MPSRIARAAYADMFGPIRFEPGQTREVQLVSFAGKREVYGFRQEVMGKL